MNGARESLKSAGASAGQSLGAALILLWLLHRALAPEEGPPNLLFLNGFPDFAGLRWAWPYLIAVAIACTLAVVRRDHTAIVRIQWYALGCGLLLTLFGLGARVGEHADPRYLFAILGGVASLYSCYACLLGHAAISMLSRTRRSNGASDP